MSDDTKPKKYEYFGGKYALEKRMFWIGVLIVEMSLLITSFRSEKYIPETPLTMFGVCVVFNAVFFLAIRAWEEAGY
jgi:hypothetical protein